MSVLSVGELGELVDFVCEVAAVACAVGAGPHDDSSDSAVRYWEEYTAAPHASSFLIRDEVIRSKLWDMEVQWCAHRYFLLPDLKHGIVSERDENGDVQRWHMGIVDERHESFRGFVLNSPVICSSILDAGQTSKRDAVRLGCYFVGCVASLVGSYSDLVPVVHDAAVFTRLAYRDYCEDSGYSCRDDGDKVGEAHHVLSSKEYSREIYG